MGDLSSPTTPHHTTPDHRLRRASVPLKRYLRPFLPPWTFPNRRRRRCAASPCDLRGDGALMLMQLLSRERNSSSDNLVAFSLSCSANDADAFAVR